MSRRGLFITGASGFVGRRLLTALARLGRPVIALDRTGTLAGDLPPSTSVCHGDLLLPETYVEVLRRCDTVLHLAAATGRASATEHRRVNVAGTSALVAACRETGVGRFLFVSSIAVKFTDRTGYHYAEAKAAAEQAVTRSGLRTAIVRPTMVFGAGSPVQEGLAKLALLPAIVAPGSGRVLVQPVHVDDLVGCLAGIVADDRFAGEVLEIGGPDVIPVVDLLKAIRVSRGGRAGRVIRLPLALIRTPAHILERAGLGAVLPVTAGQLASFANDSTAAPEGPYRESMIPLAQMLGSAGGGIVTATPSSSVYCIDAECRTFVRYLLGAEADASTVDTYRDAVARVPALSPRTAFDVVLLALARRGRIWTRLADAYATLLAPHSALRRRLVMVLAILETRTPFHHRIDTPDGAPGLALWLRTAARVAGAVLVMAAGIVVFVPLRVATGALVRLR